MEQLIKKESVSVTLITQSGILSGLYMSWGQIAPYIICYLSLKEESTIASLQFGMILFSFSEFAISIVIHDLCRVLGLATTIRAFILIDCLAMLMLGIYNNIMVVYFFCVIFGISMGVMRNLHPYIVLGHYPFQNQDFIALTSGFYSQSCLFWGILSYFICNKNENLQGFQPKTFDFNEKGPTSVGQNFITFTQIGALIMFISWILMYFYLINPDPVRNYFREWFECRFLGKNQQIVGVENQKFMDIIITGHRESFSYLKPLNNDLEHDLELEDIIETKDKNKNSCEKNGSDKNIIESDNQKFKNSSQMMEYPISSTNYSWSHSCKSNEVCDVTYEEMKKEFMSPSFMYMFTYICCLYSIFSFIFNNCKFLTLGYHSDGFLTFMIGLTALFRLVAKIHGKRFIEKFGSHSMLNLQIYTTMIAQLFFQYFRESKIGLTISMILLFQSSGYMINLFTATTTNMYGLDLGVRMQGFISCCIALSDIAAYFYYTFLFNRINLDFTIWIFLAILCLLRTGTSLLISYD